MGIEPGPCGHCRLATDAGTLSGLLAIGGRRRDRTRPLTGHPLFESDRPPVGLSSARKTSSRPYEQRLEERDEELDWDEKRAMKTGEPVVVRTGSDGQPSSEDLVG